jgi:hypothetical protein
VNISDENNPVKAVVDDSLPQSCTCACHTGWTFKHLWPCCENPDKVVINGVLKGDQPCGCPCHSGTIIVHGDPCCSKAVDPGGLLQSYTKPIEGPSLEEKAKPPHFHKDAQGVLHACYHKCRSLLTVNTVLGFLIGTTCSFPLEHALWTKVPGFRDLARYFGLLG